MSVARCQRKYCGTLMEPLTDSLGRVTFVCGACERNQRGFCRDCPAKIPGPHSMRCTQCSRNRRRSLGLKRDRERYPQRRRQMLAQHRRRNKLDPAYREYKRQYMHAYRKANPWTRTDRLYQRAYMAKRRSDPAYRERQNARRRELRAMRKAA